MPESVLNFVSNFLYGAVLKTGFRPSYSPKTLRRNFDLAAGKKSFFLKQRYKLAFEKRDLSGITAELITPIRRPSKTILFLHGGGYFMGSIYGYRNYASMFARNCNAKVYLIEYRLAPEFPYPAALEDAVKAYLEIRRLHENDPVYVVGDSAGGGLALALGLYLRDHQESLPDGILGICPWTDMTASGESVRSNDKKDVWLSREYVDYWAPWYCAQADKKNPYVSPAFGKFLGFPKTLLMVGDQEVLVDDSRMVYAAAKRDGVDVNIHLGKQMQHDWMMAMPFLPESKHAWKIMNEFLK